MDVHVSSIWNIILYLYLRQVLGSLSVESQYMYLGTLKNESFYDQFGKWIKKSKATQHADRGSKMIFMDEVETWTKVFNLRLNVYF